MPNVKISPRKKKVFRLVEDPRVGREKLPLEELTKDPIQTQKAILAPGLLSRVAGTLGVWGYSREVVDGVAVRGRPSDLWVPASGDGYSRGL